MTTEKKKTTDNNERLLLTSGRIDLERLDDQDTTDEPIDDVICLFFPIWSTGELSRRIDNDARCMIISNKPFAVGF